MKRKKIVKWIEIILSVTFILLVALFFATPHLLNIFVGKKVVNSDCSAVSSPEISELEEAFERICSSEQLGYPPLIAINVILLVAIFSIDKFLDWREVKKKKEIK